MSLRPSLCALALLSCGANASPAERFQDACRAAEDQPAAPSPTTVLAGPWKVRLVFTYDGTNFNAIPETVAVTTWLNADLDTFFQAQDGG